ncbi:HAD family hydrolase [Desmospora profundinema]|uniref:Hydrolase of the HAD superfamily n=1 Tax=Desmospora profundinema TaxID=1571184 RepID=A0ABU1IJM2_9BACL|nr:HAD-IA family hydrolase [Desmospora profundinema]MDR6224970.1 putative hydrolase of the HAD superfamily [Desmospora profundinema]
MIRAIGFDLDETLLYRSASLLRFIRHQHAEHHLAQKGVSLQEWCDRFIEWDRSGYVGKDVVYSRLIDHFHLNEYTVDVLWNEYRNHFHRFCIAMPHARHILHRLKTNEMRLALVTNGETVFQKKNAEALGILPLFDAVFVSEEEGRKKPDPELFIQAARRMGVPPEFCLFVGDHPVNDIQGAAAAGMQTAWLKGLSLWPQHLTPPTVTLQSLLDLLPLLEKRKNAFETTA